MHAAIPTKMKITTMFRNLPQDDREAGRRSKAEDKRTTAAFGPAATITTIVVDLTVGAVAPFLDAVVLKRLTGGARAGD